MTTIEVLRKARELVARPGGWTQGVFGRDSEPCCALGALGIAQDLDGVEWMDGDRHAHALLCRAAGVDNAVMGWNDAPGRTQAEVVAAFDKAIALAEAEPTP